MARLFVCIRIGETLVYVKRITLLCCRACNAWLNVHILNQQWGISAWRRYFTSMGFMHVLVYCYPRLSIRMESIWCISYDHRISYDVYVYTHCSQKCVWVPTVPGKREKSRNSKKKRIPGLGKFLKLGKYWALEKYEKNKHITSIHLQTQVRLDNFCHKIAFSQLKHTFIQLAKQCAQTHCRPS